MSRLLLVALFLEAGFVLVLAPWSGFWDHNYFAESLPLVRTIISNNYVRGAVSGLGLVNIAAGILDLYSMLIARRVNEPIAPISSPTTSED